jgi:uncharacterized membrane protein YdjX (TVP38/TMEM64 family)
MNRSIKIGVILLIVLGIFVAWRLGLFQYISINQISELSEYIHSFGFFAPIIFITIYVIATVLFLPGLPLTLLAGIVFGPVYGSVWVSIASTIGATLAFAIGRYTGRDWVVKRFSKNDLFKRLDRGVREQGWKMVAITRLVPLFPYNAQNYVYGLTDVPIGIYVLVSWLCMLPATIAYVFLSGAIIAGEGNVVKTIGYIGIAVALILVLSIIGKYLSKKQMIKED